MLNELKNLIMSFCIPECKPGGREYYATLMEAESDEARVTNRMPAPFEYGMKIPVMGTYIPEGMVICNIWMVDTTKTMPPGHGSMTVPELVDKMELHRYYGIIEAAPFCVYIAEYCAE